MAEAFSPNFEESCEFEATNQDVTISLTRSQRRAQVWVILDDFKNQSVDGNAYFSSTVVPMGGSRNTIRRRRRNGGYNY